jgi:hypothetical protein
MEINDDVNSIAPENNNKAAETTENNISNKDIVNSTNENQEDLTKTVDPAIVPVPESNIVNSHDDPSANPDNGESKIEVTSVESEPAAIISKMEEEIFESKIINEEPLLPVMEPGVEETVAHLETAEVSNLNYDALSKAELVKAAQDAVLLDNLRDAGDKLKALRSAYENAVREEQQKAIAEFIEAGGDKDSFTPPYDNTKDIFYASFETLKKRKEDQRVQIEKQKLDNLKLKQDILDKIKDIVDGEESKDSIEQIKFLQSEWKRIKVIPQEHAQKLWDTYSFYIDKFYDNRSIFY